MFLGNFILAVLNFKIHPAVYLSTFKYSDIIVVKKKSLLKV